MGEIEEIGPVVRDDHLRVVADGLVVRAGAGMLEQRADARPVEGVRGTVDGDPVGPAGDVAQQPVVVLPMEGQRRLAAPVGEARVLAAVDPVGEVRAVREMAG